MMDRRQFLIDTGLKLTGILAAAGALSTIPAQPAAAATLPSGLSGPSAPILDLVTPPRVTVARLSMREPGEYRVSALVRLEAPKVEISGIANSQQMSWSGAGSQVVPFTSFETYDGTGLAPEITVRGGRLESLSVTPIHVG
jgi:hypothetical protein